MEHDGLNTSLRPLLASAQDEGKRLSAGSSSQPPALGPADRPARTSLPRPGGFSDKDLTDHYDEASDTDRWASERDEDEAKQQSREGVEDQGGPWLANHHPEPPWGVDHAGPGPPVETKPSNEINGPPPPFEEESLPMERAKPPTARPQPRRPNPWEHANRKTFKPIITIGSKPTDRNQLQRRASPRAGRREQHSGPLAHFDVRSAFRCTSLCVGAAIDVREVYQHYQARGLTCTAYKDGLNVVVHCLHHNQDDESDAHVFYFTYGGVVLWNFEPTAEQRLIIETREAFTRGALDDPEVDDFMYVYEANKPEAKSHIHKDVIHLTTSDIMEKLAVAFSLAQSAKLGVFERITEATIQNTRSIPEQLAQTGKISLSRCAGAAEMRVGRPRHILRSVPTGRKSPCASASSSWTARPSTCTRTCWTRPTFSGRCAGARGRSVNPLFPPHPPVPALNLS